MHTVLPIIIYLTILIAQSTLPYIQHTEYKYFEPGLCTFNISDVSYTYILIECSQLTVVISQHLYL